MNRRKFVLTTVASIGLAGCSGLPGSNFAQDSQGASGNQPDAEEPPDGSTEQTVSRDISSGDAAGSGETAENTDTATEVTTTDVELEENEPTTVVTTFYDALYASDVETANDLLHPESPETLYSQEAVARFEAESHSLEEVRVVDEDGGTAIVAFVLVLVDSAGEERRTDMRVEVRLDGEDWKIWEPK